jgi:uroporphyrinogen III methyltransferase / synthase
MATQSSLHDDSEKPLVGRRVLVTRPLEQSQEIVTLLENLGAQAICYPMIEIIEPDSWDALDAAIEDLATYDWLIFTSANGVKFFFQRMAQKPKAKLSKITTLTICAIGPATAGALESFATKVDLITRDSKAEGLLQAIIEYAGGKAALRGKCFLIPRAKVAREFLPDELRKLGARVDAVEAYQTVSASTNRQALIELLASGRIDVVTFTSPSTIHHFVTLVGKENLSVQMQNVAAACIGSITAATAADYGLQNLIQPQAYTAAALVEAIAKAYKK